MEDAKGRAESLETQLQSSRQHAEQYKEMSLANENALAELNKTSEEFRYVFGFVLGMEGHLMYKW